MTFTLKEALQKLAAGYRITKENATGCYLVLEDDRLIFYRNNCGIGVPPPANLLFGNSWILWKNPNLVPLSSLKPGDEFWFADSQQQVRENFPRNRLLKDYRLDCYLPYYSIQGNDAYVYHTCNKITLVEKYKGEK